jgi:hypothetical protein
MKWSGFIIWQEVIFVFLANARRILIFELLQNARLSSARPEVAEN